MGLLDFLKRKPRVSEEQLRLALLPHAVARRIHLNRPHADAHMLTHEVCGPASMVLRLVATDEEETGVSARQCARLNLSPEQAIAIAVRNFLSTAPLEFRSDAGVIAIGAPYAPTALLALNDVVERARAQLHLDEVRWPLIVVAAGDDVLLLASEEDENGLRMLASTCIGWGRDDGTSLLGPVRFPGPAAPAEAWAPQAPAEIAGAFRELAAWRRLVQAREFVDLLSDNRKPEQGQNLSHLYVSERGELIAAWARDTRALVPNVDRIVLLDVDGSRDEIEFDVMREVLLATPAIMPWPDELSPDEQTELYSLNPAWFPVPRIRRFLQTRAQLRSTYTDWRDTEGEELLAALERGEPVIVSSIDSASSVYVNGEPLGALVTLIAADGRRGIVKLEKVQPFIDRCPLEDRHLFWMQAAFAEVMEAALRGSRAESPAAKMFKATLTEKSREPLAVLPPAPPRESDAPDDTFLRTLAKPGRWADPMSLVPTLIHRSKCDELSSALGRAVLRRRFVGDIEVMLTRNVDGDEYLSPQETELDELFWRTALLNLKAASIVPMRIELFGGATYLKWSDALSASRLLIPEVLGASDDLERRVIVTPTILELATIDPSRPDTVLRLLDLLESNLGNLSADASEFFLTGSPWVFRNGELHPWDPPQDAPYLARLDAFVRRVDSLREQHVVEV